MSPPILEQCGEPRGRPVAFLLDVAGQDESRLAISVDDDTPLQNPGRDATTLSIASIDLSTLVHPPCPHLPHHPPPAVARVRTTSSSSGSSRTSSRPWKPQYIVIDATGVGEGLWALLDKAFPTRVIPVKFTRQEKSEIGWRFLAIIETGRFRDLRDPSDAVRLQYAHCRSEVLPGPGKILRWGVPESCPRTRW